MRIGLCDSGLGGLTILRAVARKLPAFDYRYVADTANLPYGDKSEGEVRALTETMVRGLFAEDCGLVIVACNTASAETVRYLQETLLREEYPDRRLLGVIVPTVEALVEQGSARALLLATKRTVDSGKYPRELMKLGVAAPEVEAVALTELVAHIEAGEIEVALDLASSTIAPRVGEIDTVILGCTHYTELKNGLRERFPELSIISQDEVIPKKLDAYLSRHPDFAARLSQGGGRHIRLTEPHERYEPIVAQLLHGTFLPNADR